MSSLVELGQELIEEIYWFANNRTLENVKKIKSLIDAGADLEVRNSDETVLMCAVNQGDLLPEKILSMLLFASADANCRYLFGYKATPLMYATIENAKQLIYGGADVSLKSIGGPIENALWFFTWRFTEFRRRKVEETLILDILIAAF